MSIRSNIKDIVTDLIGAAIWIVTLVMIFCERMEWQYEGIIAMIVGGVFFLLPDDLLRKYLMGFIDKKIDKGKGDTLT